MHTSGPHPPARLRELVSWQAGKVAALGSRLTAARMPLSGRSEYAVLAALVEDGPLSQADLGRRLGLDRNDVTTVLTRLSSARHVSREADRADRRRNVVRPTASGRRHLQELQRHADAVQDELLAALTPTQQRTLVHLLDTVRASHRPPPA